MAKVEKLNIIFLTLVSIDSILDSNIYSDLIRCFVNNGVHVTVFSPLERRRNRIENVISSNYSIIRYRIPNIQKTNIFEKAIGTFSIDYILNLTLRKYLPDNEYQLVIYSTPPINLVKSVRYLKRKYSVKSYLLLKDIFPQNAVDLKMFGDKSLFNKFFKRMETKLYQCSDFIGCMSKANVDYIKSNNECIDNKVVEICPNSIEVPNFSNYVNNVEFRASLGIPLDSKVFIYGGNLGKPQDIPFLIKILIEFKSNKDVFFIIIGSGTEYNLLKKACEKFNFKNVLLKSYLPKNEYDDFVTISDIGMILLDHRFTIPNYPSRLLSYLEKSKPIIAITDDVTDVGSNAVERGYGFNSSSTNLREAINSIKSILVMSTEELKTMGANGYGYLSENYSTDISYDIIIEKV